LKKDHGAGAEVRLQNFLSKSLLHSMEKDLTGQVCEKSQLCGKQKKETCLFAPLLFFEAV
jgi:hypothetical protein